MTERRYADFMGFLLTPQQIMSKEESPKVASGVGLNFLHCTSVPPIVTKMEDVIAEHKRFCNILYNQSVGLPELYFGLQNPPEDIALGEYSSLCELTDAGIKFMGLAYELDSPYGAGFANPTGRLTPRGENLLLAMDDLGMVLDLSHAGHQTARDAIECVKKNELNKLRVVITHTACYEVNHHLRNFPDDILRGVADLGGVIGLSTATFMLHPTNNTLEPFFDHLHHLLKVVDANHVVLGTDGFYCTMDTEESKKLFQMMKEKIDPRGNFQARYPDQPFELNRPDRLAVIEQGMLDHGISPVTIKKVMGENLIGFFSRL